MLLPLLPSGPDGVRNTLLREAQQTTKIIDLSAEREGFEPSVGETYTRFPSVRLKPLGHLSYTLAEENLYYLSPSNNKHKEGGLNSQQLQEHNFFQTNRRKSLRLPGDGG